VIAKAGVTLIALLCIVLVVCPVLHVASAVLILTGVAMVLFVTLMDIDDMREKGRSR